MTIHLFAQGSRATSITTLAVLGAMAAVLAAPTPARAADGRPTPVLAQGAGMGVHPSAQVRVVQRALERRGYDLGAPGVDGRFGPLTRAAVRQMQADHGLAVDGVVGHHTRRALRLTRHAVGHTQPRSHADDVSNAVHERTPASAQAPPDRATVGVTTSRNASMELSRRSGSWFGSFLAGALGGVIALLIAIAVAATRRHRERAQAVRTVSVPSLADEIAPRGDDGPTRRHTVQFVHNRDAQARVSASAQAIESPPSRLSPGHRVIGYLIDSAEPGVSDDHKSLAAIEAMCERSGWELLEIVHDRDVGPTLERPALGYALERIAKRHADGLVVSDLQRLSRSIVDLGALMAWFRDAQAALIALDLDIDTSTAKGRHLANTLITLSTHARGRLAHRKPSGAVEVNGDRAGGRPAVWHDPELLERIAAMRAASMTLQGIADQLNAEGVATLRGGMKWRPSSIQSALGYRRPGPREHLPSLERRKART